MTGRYRRPEDLLREFRAPVMLVDDPDHAERLRRRPSPICRGSRRGPSCGVRWFAPGESGSWSPR